MTKPEAVTIPTRSELMEMVARARFTPSRDDVNALVVAVKELRKLLIERAYCPAKTVYEEDWNERVFGLLGDPRKEIPD